MADTHTNRVTDTNHTTQGTTGDAQGMQEMTIAQIIDRLTELYMTHGNVPVRVAGVEGPGELPPAVLSIHTAEWLEREEGEEVVIYLDPTG